MNHRKFIFLPYLICVLMVLVFILSFLNMTIKQDRKILELKEVEIQKEEARLEVLNEFTENYNELYKSYNELYVRYEELATEKGFYQGWEDYRVTTYTSLDDGCNSISSIGLNIEKWSKYFNFCAVDPKLIPYGSVVLVRFDTGIEGFLAVDCGGAIKGKHIDLYFVNDLSNAFKFGNRQLEVKVIE